MNFDLPPDLVQYLHSLDTLIDSSITPLQHSHDNDRFFDHRREHARTDWANGGLPHPDWEALLSECVRRADAAGFWRFSLPKQYGGQDGGNLWMAVIREHLAAKGLGLFNDLQNEHSVVGNFPDIVMLLGYGTAAQQEEYIPARLDDKYSFAFGLTEPRHGSDATSMETRAVPVTRAGQSGYLITGTKAWQSNMHRATHSIVFARTADGPGSATGISAFIVPRTAPGLVVESYQWTFNMPTDHATVAFRDVFVPDSALLGPLHGGLAVAQAFVHENRIRQAASSLGAAAFCVEESVRYARGRKTFGKELSANQAVQFPLVELATQVEMLRLLVRKTAWEMDRQRGRWGEVERCLSDKVAMCNYWANRLCTESADRAIQVSPHRLPLPLRFVCEAGVRGWMLMWTYLGTRWHWLQQA